MRVSISFIIVVLSSVLLSSISLSGIARTEDGTSQISLLVDLRAILEKDPRYSTLFTDMFFFRSGIGWFVTHRGELGKTVDGGKHWNVQQETITDGLFFVSPDIGWGYSFVSVGLKRTINGGESWKYVDRDVRRVHFLDPSHGWGIEGRRRIVSTRDGGDTWVPVKDVGVVKLQKIFFLDQQTGWVLGTDGSRPARGYIFHTQDGNTWERHEIGRVSLSSPLFFVDKERGFVSSPDKLLYTVDKGKTWAESQFDEAKPGLFYDLLFVNMNEGWAVGVGGIFKSTDQGESWKRVSPKPFGEILKKIAFIEQNSKPALLFLSPSGKLFRMFLGD